MQVNMWAVTAGTWHTVEMTTVYPNLTVGSPSTYGFTTYVFDKGTLNEATFSMQSWAHAWRNCNGYNYAPGGEPQVGEHLQRQPHPPGLLHR